MKVPDKQKLYYHAKISGCREEKFNGDLIIRVFTRVKLPTKFSALGINSLYNSMPNGRVNIELGEEIPAAELGFQTVTLDLCVSMQPIKLGNKVQEWFFKSACIESANLILADRYQ